MTRGPLVYCLEQTDNGSLLSSLLIDMDTGLAEQWEDVLGGTVTLRANGWREKRLDKVMTSLEDYMRELSKSSLVFILCGDRETERIGSFNKNQVMQRQENIMIKHSKKMLAMG